MNIALGIGLLMMGGWVISNPDTPPDETGINSPLRETAPQERPMPAIRPEGPQGRSSGGPTDPNSGYRYGTTQRRGGQDTTREQEFPIAPTDPKLRSADSPLASPTESSSKVTPGFGPKRVGPAASGRPSAARSSPWSQQAGRTGQARSGTAGLGLGQDISNQLQAERMIPSAGVGAAQPRASKPYANVQSAPAVSPYMNLYRPDTSNGTLNNYYQFVKPQIEQRQANTVFGGEIRGLQSSQRLQHTAVQRLGKVNQVQGTNAPEYFQNSSGYFPVFSR